MQACASSPSFYRESTFACLYSDLNLTITRLEEDLLQSTLQINLAGAFYAVQAAAQQMVKQGNGGSIIGVSSISALVGGGQQTHYTPTKAGILSLMQSCAVALGKYGIRCNALLPGTIRTQLNEMDLKDDEKRRYTESRIPLGRTGAPEDLAGPAVFLASDMSRYVVSILQKSLLMIGLTDQRIAEWCSTVSGWWLLCKSSIIEDGHLS